MPLIADAPEVDDGPADSDNRVGGVPSTWSHHPQRCHQGLGQQHTCYADHDNQAPGHRGTGVHGMGFAGCVVCYPLRKDRVVDLGDLRHVRYVQDEASPMCGA